MEKPALAGAGTYHAVQGLARGLALLAELNRLAPAAGSPVTLAHRLGLNRSTAKRILETLRKEGYVELLSDGKSYGLTPRINTLSAGYSEQAELVAAAAGHMRALTRRLLWPTNLVVMRQGALVIRLSTHPESPLSFHTPAVGDHLPMLTTASGRAYLTFCSAEHRGYLLEQLMQRQDEQGRIARDKCAISELFATTRRQGYGTNDGSWERAAGFGAIAAPVIKDAELLGCLMMVFSRRSMTLARATKAYAPELLRSASEIALQTKTRDAAAQPPFTF